MPPFPIDPLPDGHYWAFTGNPQSPWTATPIPAGTDPLPDDDPEPNHYYVPLGGGNPGWHQQLWVAPTAPPVIEPEPDEENHGIGWGRIVAIAALIALIAGVLLGALLFSGDSHTAAPNTTTVTVPAITTNTTTTDTTTTDNGNVTSDGNGSGSVDNSGGGNGSVTSDGAIVSTGTDDPCASVTSTTASEHGFAVVTQLKYAVSYGSTNPFNVWVCKVSGPPVYNPAIAIQQSWDRRSPGPFARYSVSNQYQWVFPRPNLNWLKGPGMMKLGDSFPITGGTIFIPQKDGVEHVAYCMYVRIAKFPDGPSINSNGLPIWDWKEDFGPNCQRLTVVVNPTQ